MQLETEKERVSLLETLLQTQKELADASQQLERLRQDMKVQKLKEQVRRVVLGGKKGNIGSLRQHWPVLRHFGSGPVLGGNIWQASQCGTH